MIITFTHNLPSNPVAGEKTNYSIGYLSLTGVETGTAIDTRIYTQATSFNRVKVNLIVDDVVQSEQSIQDGLNQLVGSLSYSGTLEKPTINSISATLTEVATGHNLITTIDLDLAANQSLWIATNWVAVSNPDGTFSVDVLMERDVDASQLPNAVNPVMVG